MTSGGISGRRICCLIGGKYLGRKVCAKAGGHMYFLLDKNRSPLFTGTQPARDLLVVVDYDIADLYHPVSGRFRPRTLLEKLLSDQHVSAYSFSDDGPPAGYERRHYEFSVGESVPGWINNGPVSEDDFLRFRFLYGDEEHLSHSAVVGYRFEIANRDMEARSYNGLSSEDSASRRVKDFDALSVASVMRADVFITNRPYLIERRGKMESLCKVRICSEEESLPLLLFYLRSHGDFYLYMNNNAASTMVDEDAFFRMAAMSRFPVFWQWEQAAKLISDTKVKIQFIQNYQAILRDLEHLLIVRDRVGILASQAAYPRVQSDLLFLFVDDLVTLSGLLDSLALQADLSNGMKTDPTQVSWNNKLWRKKLKHCSQCENWPLLEDTALSYIQLLAGLRNSVHGDPLSAVSVLKNKRFRFLRDPPAECRIQLTSDYPSSSRNKVADVVAKVRGQNWPEISHNEYGALFALPQPFLDRIVAYIFDSFNQTLPLIRLADFPGVDEGRLNPDPPERFLNSETVMDFLAKQKLFPEKRDDKK